MVRRLLLCMLEVPEVIRCVPFCMLEAVEGVLCVVEVVDGMRCVLQVVFTLLQVKS